MSATVLGSTIEVCVEGQRRIAIESMTGGRYVIHLGARADLPRSTNKGAASDGREYSLCRVITIGADAVAPTQMLRVIAVSPVNGARIASTNYSFVVCAPDKLVLFEPQLRELLAVFSAQLGSNFPLVCLYEKSCGAVIFRRRSGNTEYLLIKNKKGNNWGFPKGHIEAHENERQTAMREVLEETGLHIKPLGDFRAVSEYHPKGKIIKKVVFFIAEMPDEEIVLQQSEIDRCLWADYGLAMRYFRFNNDRNVLTRARDWLRRH